MTDHRAGALTTTRQLRADLPAFLTQIRMYEWGLSAQQYDTTRSSGSTGPIEHHRTQLVHDPARNAWLAFCGYIRAAEGILCAGTIPTTANVDDHLTSVQRRLGDGQPIPRRGLADTVRLLDLARVLQLQWTTLARQHVEERKACRHCHRTDLGSTPRGGLCTSCYAFRQDWKRLPTGEELRRYGETGRWKIRA